MRELLFADVPLEEWKPTDGVSDSEPWSSFERARVCLASGDAGGAVEALRAVTAQRDVQSRQVLQAWHCLRQLGVSPPSTVETRVYGVVLDVPVDGGLDVLAAYADHSALYLNHAGNVIVWDTPDAAIDKLVDALLGACAPLATRIWASRVTRRKPSLTNVCISVLTPSGAHLREGLFSELDADSMTEPVMTAGTLLLQALA